MEIINNILLCSLSILIVRNLLTALLSSDHAQIWSPMTFISLVYLYYCVIPYYFGDIKIYGIDASKSAIYMNIGALLSYICISLGFHIRSTANFRKLNSTFTVNNARIYGIALFIIAVACYVPFRGFHFSFFNTDEGEIFDRKGFTSYFIDMISLFCASCSLIWATHKKKIDLVLLLIVWLSLVFYIIAGFRFRIVILIISIATAIYLFPMPKRLNYVALSAIAILVYVGFGLMDGARSYGHGIDIEKVEFDKETVGAGENSYVYVMSALTMHRYDNETKLYFEPFVTALCMPIPRVLAPWKPDGKYLKDAQRKVLGTTDYGAAFVFFTEAFISWGWLGVIIYSFFVGWLSKVFWNNYSKNRQSLGAIILLGLYNGFCYVLISRGYMAQVFNTFIYFVLLPFWFAAIIKKIFRI